MERIESGKMVSYEGGDKAVSIRLLIRRAAPARPGLRAEGKPDPREVAKVRKWLTHTATGRSWV